MSERCMVLFDYHTLMKLDNSCSLEIGFATDLISEYLLRAATGTEAATLGGQRAQGARHVHCLSRC